MSVVPIQTPFQNLSTMAVVFCTLSALFGAYVVLTAIAVWSTYRRYQETAYKRLLWVTVILFLVLCAHYSARAFTFGRARIENPGPNEESRWTVPLIFVGAITSTISGLISDGIVAWRFYNIYGKPRWALYVPAAAVIITALLGFSGDFQQLAIYRSLDLYNDHIVMIALDVNAAWGWCIFTVNTILTGSIIGRIIYAYRSANAHLESSVSNQPYSTIIKAFVESALVTWIGLLLYEIASLAPTGGITANFDIGYVMVCITPIFFGISQCLITARLALRGDESPVKGSPGDDSSGYSINYPPSKEFPAMTFKTPIGGEAESTYESSVGNSHSHDKELRGDACAV